MTHLGIRFLTAQADERLGQHYEENLHIVDVDELEDAEKIDDLLCRLGSLTDVEREFLIVRGFDPDTGRDLD